MDVVREKEEIINKLKAECKTLRAKETNEVRVYSDLLRNIQSELGFDKE